MQTFNEIVDFFLIGGTLWVVWELVAAAKIIAAPNDEFATIVSALKGLKVLVAKLNSNMAVLLEAQGVSGSNGNMNSENELDEGEPQNG